MLKRWKSLLLWGLLALLAISFLGGQATPMSYTYKGRQYVVIAAGGQASLGTKIGDHLVAFALPE